MANTDVTIEEAPKARSKLPLILGLVLALAGGAAGFLSVRSGMVPNFQGMMGALSQPRETSTKTVGENAHQALVFVPIDPLVISLSQAGGRHLRFVAQLEVQSGHEDEVLHMMPRVVDVLNSYLRAVELSDLQDAAALVRLRAQMLRRVQVVLGGQHVSDLLIMEFVLK